MFELIWTRCWLLLSACSRSQNSFLERPNQRQLVGWLRTSRVFTTPATIAIFVDVSLSVDQVLDRFLRCLAKVKTHRNVFSRSTSRLGLWWPKKNCRCHWLIIRACHTANFLLQNALTHSCSSSLKSFIDDVIICGLFDRLFLSRLGDWRLLSDANFFLKVARQRVDKEWFLSIDYWLVVFASMNCFET